jgi:hypothetical protein
MARAAGAQLHTIAIDARGPNAEELSIDIAWLGAAHPRRLLLHSSGLHGVEAYAGSAVQLALLAAPPKLGTDDAMVLVHALNPWGMAWLRRTNENNVDLNRNFLRDGESWSGSHPLYRALNSLINPESPPGFDAFTPRIAWFVARHGMGALIQAIAEGQYDYPRGLFYGGNMLQQGPAHYLAWLQQHLSGARRVFALDLHSGLGRWGGEMLIPEPANVTTASMLSRALRRSLAGMAGGDAVAYTTRGDIGLAMTRAFSGARVDYLTQELGTYSPLRVLRALREENRWHHFGSGGVDHSAKRRLLEALCPGDSAWSAQGVKLGVSLALDTAAWLFQEEHSDGL